MSFVITGHYEATPTGFEPVPWVHDHSTMNVDISAYGPVPFSKLMIMLNSGAVRDNTVSYERFSNVLGSRWAARP